MGAMLGERGFVGKTGRLILAAALAGGLALQLAPPGVAADEPAPNGVVVAPTQPPAVVPVPEPTATPLPTPTAPSPTPTVADPPTASAPASGPERAATEAADPLTVQGYVDRGYVGKPFEAPLVISGGTAPYTATAVDVPPPGLTFDEANLRFVGTPTSEQYAVAMVTVQDSSTPQQVVAQEVSISLYNYYAPAIEPVGPTGKFADAILGSNYSGALRVSGSLPYTVALVSGGLPPGLTLRGGTAGDAVSGTPTAVGTYAFTLRATDQYTSTEASLSITVRATAPYGVGYVVPDAVLGEPYSAKIASVSGGVAPYQIWWDTQHYRTGSLGWHDPGPDGLTIDGDGVLSGIPTRAGRFLIKVSFRDAGQVEREIFWTAFTVLETRPPAVEQPPVTQPPAAGGAPPAAVLPAGAVQSASSGELAATGLQSGTLNALLWTAGGLLAAGSLIAVAAHRRWRRGGAA
ncbi:MAG TPA: Ig domain-containing protein [Paenarthrobacter sp.]|nr:Ig domain-containing protein [Paenarthrobacter sp.]